MYRAFNLTQCNWNGFSRASGDVIYKRDKETVRESLESFLTNGIIDGTKLSAHWFPAIKADVFISHSHKDEPAAIACASWLKDTFNLECFIDSCVWGHADDLLKIIDQKYCMHEDGKNYDYDKRNRSTSHVHMMLANALNEMLEACESVLFINSPNSIASNQTVEKTQSPWLFLELGTMRIIRRKKPSRMIVEMSFGNKKAALNIDYEVPLAELTPLTGAQMRSWRNSYLAQTWQHPLDLLYEEIAPAKN